MSEQSIPLSDTGPLRASARRTTIVRLAAAAALLGLALAAVLLARHPRVQEVRFLPQSSNGIVVLDLSASISSETYSRIGQTLRELSTSRGRYGLVVFSDTAYEALPPGSPTSAFKPLVRYFTLPPRPQAGVAPSFPVNPWTNSFSAGTRISTGLDLARSILIDDRLARPAVLLISDLDDDQGDLPALNTVAVAYRQEGIRLQVVGLDPAPENERLFRRFVAGDGTFAHARLPGENAPGTARTTFPVALVAISLVLVALLALNELWTARLEWGASKAAA